MHKNSVRKVYNQHIKGTPKKSVVFVANVSVGTLRTEIMTVLSLPIGKVHTTTLVLKHLHDDRPPTHIDKILRNLKRIIEQPDKIYENKKGSSKTGEYMFQKKVGDNEYIVVMQKSKDSIEPNCIVTCWIHRDRTYLKNCTLLWKF